MQSKSLPAPKPAIGPAPKPAPRHIGVIMDGNGRWASRRGLARLHGHRAGVRAVRRVVRAAQALGVETLTAYVFSADNWRRPADEVAEMMRLIRRYLAAEPARLAAAGVRLSVIGRRDRLPDDLPAAIARAEALTREAAAARSETMPSRAGAGEGIGAGAGQEAGQAAGQAASEGALHFRIALDYSSRDAILAAVDRLQTAQSGPRPSREAFAAALAGDAEPVPDIDLVIRTSGERRLSDFFLWECAYAELYFTDRLWPDFTAADLQAAIDDYRRRERRFGALPPGAPSEQNQALPADQTRDLF